LEHFEKARTMHERTESLHTPEGVAALQSVGDVLSSMYPARLDGALAHHEQAFDISKELGVAHSPKTVALLRRMAFEYKALDNLQKSAECLACASAILVRSKSYDEIVVGNRLEEAKVEPEWGVYFEVSDGVGHTDNEGRGFPHSLVSFETKQTVGISPKHIKICFDSQKMSEKAGAWTLDADALQQTPALRQLTQSVKGRQVVGYLSPLHAVNLPDHAKEKVGIPPAAKHFMFSYPVELKAAEAKVAEFLAPAKYYERDPDVAFLRNGGYVYLDGSAEDVVRINAVLTAPGSGGLQFGPPLKWEHRWTSRLMKAQRFRPITLPELRTIGATHFSWIRPNEVMWFGRSAGGAPICPFGGFAYICHDATLGSHSGKSHESNTKAGFSVVRTADDLLLDSFKRFDTNGNGFIDRAELGFILTSVGGSKFTSEDVNMLLDHVDLNGDGRIDYREFLTWVLHDVGGPREKADAIASRHAEYIIKCSEKKTTAPSHVSAKPTWEFEVDSGFRAFAADCQEFIESRFVLSDTSGQTRINVRTCGMQVSVDFRDMTSKVRGSARIRRIRRRAA